MRSYWLILLIGFSACSPQKRLTRLLDKYPQLMERDSVTTYDTIFRPEFKHDTIFYPVKGERDTFIIRTERGVTNVYLNEDKSEARVDQEIKPDTIVNTNTIIKQMVKEKETNWWLVGALVFFILINSLIIIVKK